VTEETAAEKAAETAAVTAAATIDSVVDVDWCDDEVTALTCGSVGSSSSGCW